jgi:YhcG PDDEXK nuclease domain
MNLYLSAVNDMLRHPDDQPGIGLILCKTPDRVVAEYALRDVSRPIGISKAYELAASLPAKSKGTLSAIEEIESELMEKNHDDSIV